MAFFDICPRQNGHALIIPKGHFVDVWDVTSDVLGKVIALTKRASQRMNAVLDTEGVNTLGASGKPLGMHVIPLGKGERTMFAEWWSSAAVKATRSELDSLASTLSFS